MFPISDVVFLGREGCNKCENKIAYRFKVSSASFTAYDIFNWVDQYLRPRKKVLLCIIYKLLYHWLSRNEEI